MVSELDLVSEQDLVPDLVPERIFDGQSQSVRVIQLTEVNGVRVIQFDR